MLPGRPSLTGHREASRDRKRAAINTAPREKPMRPVGHIDGIARIFE
jgi:hypothetical protein